LGLHLIASASGLWSYLDQGWYLLLAILALGVVIFVHELGHFLVAKACGVKCEKFYLGFDIGGLKLARFRWGETEYGVGILPLGGYVKMLGQEDNPAKLREELERAKAETVGGETPTDSGQPSAQQSPESDPEHAQEALYNPRSYLAKSVPARMAIISAGVAMNLVFALIAAVAAYWLGVEQIPARIGEIVPGSGAWRCHLRNGDEILAIEGRPIELFRELRTGISLGDNLANGVTLSVRRPGVSEPFQVTVVPDVTGNMPTIGVRYPETTRLHEELAWYPNSPAVNAQPPLQPGDRIEAVNGRAVNTAGEFRAAQALAPAEPLRLTVRRPAKSAKGKEPAVAAEELAVTVAPRPMMDLGVVMEMGDIAAVQSGSPAEKAGLMPGDMIHRIDGEMPGDPLSIPARLPPAGDTVTIAVSRRGVKDPIEIPVVLRKVDWIEAPSAPGAPVSVPSLGIAYRVLNRVNSVEPDSPGAKAGLRKGDVVVQATIIPPDRSAESKMPAEMFEKVRIPISEKTRNWPYFFHILQNAIPGSQIELELEGKRAVQLQAQPVPTWYNPDRGFFLQPDTFIQKAHGMREALRLGFRETADATTLVYDVLRKVGSRQISPREFSGPLGILREASYSARSGLPRLLLFLTLISANLAVINFLPIPILDGGHMVFLAYEGIRGKPANENLQLILSYLGLFLILALMVWVVGLDLGLIARSG